MFFFRVSPAGKKEASRITVVTRKDAIRHLSPNPNRQVVEANARTLAYLRTERPGHHITVSRISPWRAAVLLLSHRSLQK